LSANVQLPSPFGFSVKIGGGYRRPSESTDIREETVLKEISVLRNEISVLSADILEPDIPATNKIAKAIAIDDKQLRIKKLQQSFGAGLPLRISASGKLDSDIDPIDSVAPIVKSCGALLVQDFSGTSKPFARKFFSEVAVSLGGTLDTSNKFDGIVHVTCSGDGSRIAVAFAKRIWIFRDTLNSFSETVDTFFTPSTADNGGEGETSFDVAFGEVVLSDDGNVAACPLVSLPGSLDGLKSFLYVFLKDNIDAIDVTRQFQTSATTQKRPIQMSFPEGCRNVSAMCMSPSGAFVAASFPEKGIIGVYTISRTTGLFEYDFLQNFGIVPTPPPPPSDSFFPGSALTNNCVKSMAFFGDVGLVVSSTTRGVEFMFRGDLKSLVTPPPAIIKTTTTASPLPVSTTTAARTTSTTTTTIAVSVGIGFVVLLGGGIVVAAIAFQRSRSRRRRI
jgi:hypothetical protein